MLPSVTKDFLISHYHFHPNHTSHNDDFYIVLVDPISKTKIDIFDAKVNPPEETLKVQFKSYHLTIPSVEDQLVTTVLEACRVLDGNTNDPKQFTDGDLLMEIANIQRAEAIWKKRKSNKHSGSMIATFSQAKSLVGKHPELLVERMYRKREPYTCQHCLRVPEFPITPMEKIYKVLGYIE